MTLEDFERQLAADKAKLDERGRRKEQTSPRQRDGRRHHQHSHHHNRSHRTRGREDEGHRHKRRRRGSHIDDEGDDNDDESEHHKQHRKLSAEVRIPSKFPSEKHPSAVSLKRDAWMETPSAGEVDFVQRNRKESSPAKVAASGGESTTPKVHEKELNRHVKDVANDNDPSWVDPDQTEHIPDYIFGDKGSQWRMTKLRGVYRDAENSGRSVEEVALKRYGSLRGFDDAREEETELDRRKTYGKTYITKERPSGELYSARALGSTNNYSVQSTMDEEFDKIVESVAVTTVPEVSKSLDQTDLNKLKARLMKARLRQDPHMDQLQKDYDAALAASMSHDQSVITLSAMDNRMLSSAPRNEVKIVQNRRGIERGNVEANDDMSIEDMVREERRTRDRAGGEGRHLAERIAKDAKFDNDLEYMNDNATKLAKHVHKSEANLRNVAIHEYQKLNNILENCPLCHHEDSNTPPIAPTVSLATRTYLTLPTQPELTSYAAMIVPVQHYTNLLQADHDEWEEIRNFMKSLTRFYHDRDCDVIFYENAAHPHRKPHAALSAIPLSRSQADTAPAFFKEAFLSAEDEWSQHKKVIDTLAKSKQGLGRAAFRESLAKEMPYFHVWFELDGGLAHVVENPDKWPRGDLFAREIIGSILGVAPDIVKRQGRWQRGHDERIERFRRRWAKFDWTKVLLENA